MRAKDAGVRWQRLGGGQYRWWHESDAGLVSTGSIAEFGKYMDDVINGSN